ncbi:uncharacterized protein B0I36DRAFT_336135 [Microdochium trichocladiopsis]|uniref:Uncharacterized protein n=1 Tax=Microdochium trichocladiopsis TaxID=1682393 RepID=A0A9P8XUT7_9PEZI|nr:uncharacterized protein B0I36DRAFT_336135 [Microdochium trichocladiopsis]KAH7018519.1 hypothetical protein B0I36DRAFT_336135 [Microdochium trichocladiopsis]
MPGAGGSTSSTRAEGKCNSFGSFVHGRLGRHASSSAGSSSPPSEVSANEEGAGAGAIAAPSTPLTPSPPTPPPEHDGLIRMWDLYDAVVRGLADPGLRWMVLWRPSTVPASQPLSDWTVPDGGRPAMENSGGASYNPTGAEQAGYQNEGRDVEADEHKRNLAAWQLPPPPPLSPLSRSSAAGLFATMATPAAETNIWDPNTIHNLVDDQQLLSGAAVSREDLLGGCTAELMKRGAELIVVRRRDINENAFLGWSQFRHFQGRYVNPHWLAVGGAGAGGGGSSAGGLGAGDANGTGVVGSGRTMMMSSSLERIGGDGRVVITGQPTRSHRREL